MLSEPFFTQSIAQIRHFSTNWKQMVYVLIRRISWGASNAYPHHMFSWKNREQEQCFQSKQMSPPPWVFSFSTAVTLKIRSRSPKSNQFFMSQLYIHENLVRIKPLVHKILLRECRADTNGVCTKNNMSSSPYLGVRKYYLDTPISMSCGEQWWFQLTLKTPRKPASENVVCLCRLLSILANFSNLFLHTGKQCGPRSDCS